MGLFRKKETLNEQLLREAGLDRVVFNTPPPQPRPGQQPEPEPAQQQASPPAAAPAAPEPEPSRPASRGKLTPESNAWDVMATVMAQIHGHRVDFTTVPSGDLVVTAGNVDDDLSPLADAIEEHLAPPYNAIAARQEGNVWEVGAKRIQVAEFAYADSETLELSQREGKVEFRIDGAPTDVAPPVELQEFGAHVGSDFDVWTQRIDGDYWEVRVTPL